MRITKLVLAAVLAAGATLAWAESGTELRRTGRFAHAFTVHNVFGDHMVVQRDKPVRVSGTAPSFSKVEGDFNGVKAEATSDKDGNWTIEFPAKLPAGGPYTMTFAETPNRGPQIKLNDILVGDVWIAGGQSNMEFPVWGGSPFFRLKEGQDLMKNFRDNGIRAFVVPNAGCADGPCADAPGRCAWEPLDTPEAVCRVTAVGFYFANALRREVKTEKGKQVPIGIIHANWGGSSIRPWIPEWAYCEAGMTNVSAQLDRWAAPAAASDDWPASFQSRLDASFALIEDWVARFKATDPAASAQAIADWTKPGCDLKDWHTVTNLNDLVCKKSVGAFWCRTEIEVPEKEDGKGITIFFGASDTDEAYLDGVKIGATTVRTHIFWQHMRKYFVPGVKAGRHTLAVRVFAHNAPGGFWMPQLRDFTATRILAKLDNATWSEKTEFVADKAKLGNRPGVPSAHGDRYSNGLPTTLWNAMLAPFTAMNVKGAIWYQGCSDAGDVIGYRKLQKMLIESWRKEWRDPEMPVLITGLSAYFAHSPWKPAPADHWKQFKPYANLGYAPFRQMQAEFIDYPFASCASSFDVGEQSDIHPKDKKTVGERLAHDALRVAYGDKSRLPGPRVEKAVRDGAAVRVSFKDVGAGLYAKGGAFNEGLWALKDARGVWTWATAEIGADSVVTVSAEGVTDPVEVSYGFRAYHPAPNFYRKGDDLPVFGFDTVVEGASSGATTEPEAQRKIDAEFERAELKSLSVGLSRGGKTVFTYVHGEAPFDAETPLETMSVTKSVTAMLVLQLVTEGKLKLEDPMVKYIPEFPDPEVTVVNMLTHTSGWRNGKGKGLNWKKKSDANLKDFYATMFRELPRETKFQYFSSGYAANALVKPYIRKGWEF